MIEVRCLYFNIKQYCIDFDIFCAEGKKKTKGFLNKEQNKAKGNKYPLLKPYNFCKYLSAQKVNLNPYQLKTLFTAD